MRNGVLEVQGPENLALAGQKLQERPELDMAVINDLVTPWQAQQLRVRTAEYTEISTETDDFYEVLPELFGLDAIAATFVRKHRHDLGGLELMRSQIALAFINNQPQPAHLDIAKQLQHIVNGPFTLSIRIDRNYHIDRTFYARRLHRTIDAAGKIVVPTECESYGTFAPDSRFAQLHPDDFSRALQQPGTGILIPNHPEAAIHAVDDHNPDNQPPFGTRAVILAYGMVATHATI